MMTVEVSVVAEEDVELPGYSTDEAAGADVRAYIQTPIEVLPGESALIPTGLRLDIPIGYEIQVRPRSGLALKNQVTVLNTPGTIDSDYRGEIKVILINHGKHSFIVEPGMRIAQLIIAPVLQAIFLRKTLLSATERGAGGFGHTGTN